MANTKIGILNRADTATLKNGTGGGAPALDETSPYLMSNVTVADRYTIWKTANPPSGSPVTLDLDFGSNRVVTAIGLLGYRPVGALGATSVAISSAASAAGYPPAGWTAQATINGISGNPRDIGAVIASVNHRYWRFEFTNVGAFSLGRVWLGDTTDLGAIHSPGGLYAPFRNRLETPLPGGAVVLTDLGDPGADFTLPWESIELALRNTLITNLHSLPGPVLLIDADANFFEVYARGGRVTTVRKYTSLFDANIELARLP